MGALSKIRALLVMAAVLAIGVPASAGAYAGRSSHGQASSAQSHDSKIKHVLLISVDGLHQTDLQWYVKHHRHSELAKLVQRGIQYRHAQAPIITDSFPGMLAQTTGGDPRVTGVYYDASYSHALLVPGTTKCTGQPTGSPVNYDETIDKNTSSIDAGQGLSGLPGSILNMTSGPQTLIDPTMLPVDPKTCTPVYPHQFLKVNTIFEVARQHGLRTAWSDKHPAYEILNGPSGTGVQDLFTPEINSNATGFTGGVDWSQNNAATMQYDSYKVQSVLNEIHGRDHTGRHRVGVPGIFGMNFQTVSTAEKLPTSNGLTGGYAPGTLTPGPLLRRALEYVNRKLTAMVMEIKAQGLPSSTAIILSAKHGQSPRDPGALTRTDSGPIVDGINAAWTATHPGAGKLVAAATTDDVLLLWLSDRSQAAADFTRNYLLTHSATGNTVDGALRTLAQSGLKAVFAGGAAAHYFGVSTTDPRHPDVFGVVQPGVVYTGGKGKIAEHGGTGREDRNVPLVVYAPASLDHKVSNRSVKTTQIAPTILRLLGLAPSQLQAVQIEGTQVLPGLTSR